MPLREGPAFVAAKPDKVIDHLRARTLSAFMCPAPSLSVIAEGDDLLLRLAKDERSWPLRRSFVLKMFNWHNVPRALETMFEPATLAAMLTDLLRSMHGGEVTVRLEGGEALTVTSGRFNLVPDLDVIHACRPLGIDSVTRDDFRLRVYVAMRGKIEPVPGDVCGYGYNAHNSETGFSALEMTHFVLRYICSNGAVFPSAKRERRIHYGYREGELHAFLARQIEEVDRSREEVITALRRSTALPARDTLASVRGRLGAIVGRSRVGDILGGIAPSASLFDLFNVLTAEARDFDAYPRLQLETLAGNLVMDASENN
jgi:hypothetical protein